MQRLQFENAKNEAIARDAIKITNDATANTREHCAGRKYLELLKST